MRALVATACAAAIAACSPSVTIYHRTGPRSVEVDKRASSPRPFALAERDASGKIAIRVKQSSNVSIRRTVHYNALAVKYDHSGSAFNEVAEMVVALVMMPMVGAFWGFGDRLDTQDTQVRKTVRHRRMLLELLDPTTSVFTDNIRTVPFVSERVFSDPPTLRDYEIRLPAAAVAVSYRLFDGARREVGRGTGTTDLHGEVAVEPADEAIAVELGLGDATLVVPILPAGAAAAEATEAALKARGSVTPPASGVAYAAWSRARRPARIPRLTIAVDLVPFLIPPVVPTGRLELRLGKFSLSAIAGLEHIDYTTTAGDSDVGKGTTFGGQLRYYMYGDFGRGAHFGAEVTQSDLAVTVGSGKRVVSRYGLFVGYKHTFDFGATLDIQYGYRYSHDDDVMGGNPLTDFTIFGHLDLAWSF